MLGFFIILGVLVVVVLRHQIWPNTEGGRGKAEEVEEASRRMKREMEQSADKIIERMGAHIDRLEHLVEEADERAKALEAQLASLRHPALAQRRENHAGDFDDLLAASLAVENEVGPMPPLLRPSSRPSPAAAAYRVLDDRSIYDAEDHAASADEGEAAEERFVDAAYSDSGLLTVKAWEEGEHFVEEPEVVVSASVADVADLPMTPEEEAWAAAEEGLPEIIRDEYPEPSVGREPAWDEEPAAPSPFTHGGHAFPPKAVPLTPPDPSFAADSQGVSDEAIFEPEESAADADIGGMTHTLLENTDAFFVDPVRDEPVAVLSEPVEEAIPAGQDTAEEAVRHGEAAGDADHAGGFAADKESDEAPPVVPLVTASLFPEGDSTAQRVRERLAQGGSAVDIAREFHIGRGAVELIGQMEKNKTER